VPRQPLPPGQLQAAAKELLLLLLLQLQLQAAWLPRRLLLSVLLWVLAAPLLVRGAGAAAGGECCSCMGHLVPELALSRQLKERLEGFAAAASRNRPTATERAAWKS
jgi:hypothetical protein